MKKWNQSKCVIGFMILCLFAACWAEKSPATLLQEGLYAEETEGDLDKAISIYQQVLAESADIQRIAAQATYQLGLCHLKKDEKEKAAEYFQQVVSDYSTQKTFVKQAGEQLDELGIKAQTDTTQTLELSNDTGKSSGRESIAMSGPAVQFEAPDKNCVVKAIKVYGSHYGANQSPQEDFHVYLCDEDFKTIADFTFPYSRFQKGDKDGNPKGWVTLPIAPTEVPNTFFVSLDFNPERTKGVYVHYDGSNTGHSFVAIPGQTLKPFERGEWMIHAVVTSSQEVSINPHVISTNPVALSDNVDPQLDKITVTFNTEMMDGSWSWTGGGETYPQTPGKPYYDQTKTICTLPVKLEAGKVYWVGINSPSYKNFKTPDGEPAKRYVILFATKSADGQPTPIPDDMKAKAEAINRASATSPAQPDKSNRGQGKRTVPQVVSTIPAALSRDADFQLDKITVTFNTEMMDGSWSWTGGGETYPQTTGKPYYDQTKTICTLPVKLEPGKVYWVGINSPSHKNFKTPDRKPARRYVILFATKGADGQPTTIPDDMKAQAEAINKLNKQLSSEKKSEIIGQWQSVDFVDTPDQFQPGTPKWKGDLSLKELTAKSNGSTSSFFTWTDGWIHHKDGKTKAEYYIKNIEGEKYLFLPWLSGDVTERGQQPKYYVLKAVASDSLEAAANDERAKEIQEALTAAEVWLALVDQGDYPASWDAAAGSLQKMVDKPGLIASLETARKPMGKMISREVLSKTYTQQVPGAPDGEYVIILFKTRYEKKESAVETVTPMLDKDGKWKVSGYYIK